MLVICFGIDFLLLVVVDYCFFRGVSLKVFAKELFVDV